MSLTAGEVFGRYTIEALLGEGGMGEVYRAWDTRLQRKVALKVLHRAAADSPTESQGISRMLREARAAAALNHPNVVAIHDVGEEGGAPFLVMELIEGASLRRYIGTDVPLSTRIRWLLEIARALAAAHRAGLVHRDVKPENVMLRDDGMLKVLDFGIAKKSALVVDAHGRTLPAELATLTGKGMLVGTLSYMAPEQLQGDELDGRADQFSWAVLAYELLSGKLPFGAGKDAVGLIASILGKEPPPLEGVPETVNVLVRRALSKARDARFASMDEVVSVLESLITGDRPARSLHGLPGGTSTTSSAVSEPNTAQVQVLSASRRRGRWPFALGAIALVGAGVVTAALVRRPLAPPAAPAAPSPSASAAMPTPITELAVPKTPNAEALGAYREGLQGLRDAAWTVAHDAFERAAKLDPSFAAAHLRLAQTGIWCATLAEAREAFRKAISLRSALDERDRALLDALEPILRRDPPEPLEMAKRFEAAARRYPFDAEFAMQDGSYVLDVSPLRELELSERCLALDPLYADCWQHKAGALARLERIPEALAAFDRCLSISPGADDCMLDRSRLYARTGQCARLEEDARRRLTAGPGSASEHLANALFALGRPLVAVREAMDQAPPLPESSSTRKKLEHDIQIALLTGRLNDAERAARQIAEQIEGAPVEEAHVGPTMVLVSLQQELGKQAEAAKLAGEFLARRDAWTKSITPSLWDDSTIMFLKARLNVGAISREQYAASRSEWMRTWESRLSDDMRGVAWIVGYAKPASTAADAQEALAVRPKLMHTLYYSIRSIDIEAAIGKVYLLAGNHDEALPYLKRAVGDCSALNDMVAHTLAEYYLGRALEAQQDKAGACKAYQAVLDRWSPTKASVTAKAAAERAKALGCPRSAR